MSTAVTANSVPDQTPSKSSSEATGKRGSWQAYKPGEGYVTRLGMMVVIMAYVGFACHHWFFGWASLRELFDNFFNGISPAYLGWITGWTFTYAKWVAGAGTFALAALGLLVGYYFIYVKRETAEFLIKTDTELSKVTWPQITPWFKPDTKVWGATYVVLIVIAAMTLYVAGVDVILHTIANYLFYKG